MNGNKLDFLKRWICLIVLFLCMCWTFYSAEATLITENIGALVTNETDLVKICPMAGGFCCIDIDFDIDGISMDFD